MWEAINFWGEWHRETIMTAVRCLQMFTVFLVILLFIAGPPNDDDHDTPAAA